MGYVKSWLLELQEDAWHFILEADLGETPTTLQEAKEKFLEKHPGQERLWQAALEEYHGESDIGYEFYHNQANTENLAEE